MRYTLYMTCTHSILNTGFNPTLDRIPGKQAGDFDMADLLNFAGVLS